MRDVEQTYKLNVPKWLVRDWARVQKIERTPEYTFVHVRVNGDCLLPKQKGFYHIVKIDELGEIVSSTKQINTVSMELIERSR